MTDHYVTLDPEDPTNPGPVRRVLGRLLPEDSVIVTMERFDAHQTDAVTALLREEGLQVSTKGGHGDEDFYLIGYKKRP